MAFSRALARVLAISSIFGSLALSGHLLLLTTMFVQMASGFGVVMGHSESHPRNGLLVYHSPRGVIDGKATFRSRSDWYCTCLV